LTLKIFLPSAAIVGVCAALLASTVPSQAKGCLKGAVVGGVAGHYAGHHAVLGAVGGCIAGHHLAKEAEKKKLEQGNDVNPGVPPLSQPQPYQPAQ
jgi:hypothetical protein